MDIEMEKKDRLSSSDIQRWLLEKTSQILMLSQEDIDCDAHLNELGMDSQEVFALIGSLEDWLSQRIPTSIVEDAGSINGIVSYVKNQQLKS